MEENKNPNNGLMDSLPKSLTTVTTFSKLIALFLFILLPFTGLFIGMRYQEKLAGLSLEKSKTACTMEAKVCPDGTSVGRSGPNCEFAPCPPGQRASGPAAPDPTANWKTYENREFGFQFKYPNNFGTNFNPMYPLDTGFTRYNDLLNDGEDPGGICYDPCHKGDFNKLKASIEQQIIPTGAGYGLEYGRFIKVDGRDAIQSIWYAVESGTFFITTSFITDKGIITLGQILPTDAGAIPAENIDRNLELASEMRKGKIDNETNKSVETHQQIISTFTFE